MRNVATKSLKPLPEANELHALLNRITEAKGLLERLLRQADEVLQHAPTRRNQHSSHPVAPEPPRPSPLDQIKEITTATADLRVASGNLSAERVAKLYGISLSCLAGWLGRTRQALTKTPDADSLQPILSYFERAARLRLVTESDAEFRKWLRMPNRTLANATPISLLEKGQWQVIADKVDDMLTGMPT